MGTRTRPFNVSRLTLALVAAVIAAEAALLGAGLRPETQAGWQTYVAATERRRARELGDRSRFLVMDFQGAGAEDRRQAMAGALVVRRMTARNAAGQELEVPGAMVHHWRGAVFIPHVAVTDLVSRLELADPPAVQEDVLRSSVLSRSPGSAHVFLRLQRQKIVTVVYNTEHDVTFTRYDAMRAASASMSTKIAEVASPGTRSEQELPPGEDRGFLWRLNAYWRYQAVPGGVLAECESVSLSRDVPSVFMYLVGSLVESTARESMESTLSAVRQRFGS